MFHYFYKITNNINNHFYYGIHSTDNLDDGYMGSGSRLHRAYKKYGIENFTKEILKFFDTREECAKYEREIVNENLINDNSCYNISLGGKTPTTINAIVVKTETGKILCVNKNDPDYLNGTLKPIWCGKHHTDETKQKLKQTLHNIQHQQNVKNSRYNTCWMNNGKESISVNNDKIDYYLSLGYVKGRLCIATENNIKANNNRIWLNKDGKTTFVDKSELRKYIQDGWVFGRTQTPPKKQRKTENYKLYLEILEELSN